VDDDSVSGGDGGDLGGADGGDGSSEGGSDVDGTNGRGRECEG